MSLEPGIFAGGRLQCGGPFFIFDETGEMRLFCRKGVNKG